MRRTVSLLILTAILSALSILLSAPASAANTCTSHKVVKVTGARTVTTETKSCTKDRGGYTRSTRTETCTKARAGKACTSVRVTDSHTVSVKGNATDTHTVTTCTKPAGKSSVCTTDTASTTGS